MTKEFNTTGSCNPAMHYMVDTSKKLAQIEELIDRGKYFTINRARQFGKTTTMNALLRLFADEYIAIKISFEGFGPDSYNNDLQEQNIIKNIVRLTDFIINKLGFDSLEHKIKQANN